MEWWQSILWDCLSDKKKDMILFFCLAGGPCSLCIGSHLCNKDKTDALEMTNNFTLTATEINKLIGVNDER